MRLFYLFFCPKLDSFSKELTEQVLVFSEVVFM